MQDPERLIESDHPARAIWQVCEELDLEALYEPIEAVQGVAGQRAHDPRMLLSLWVYGYSRGVSSARELSRLLQWEPGMRWLTGLQRVNYHTLSDFRSRHREAINQLLTQVLAMLTAAGVVKLERVTLDGTRIRATAGQDSLSREATIEQHLKQAQAHVQALEAEDYEQGVGRAEAARRRAWREKQQRLERARQQLQQEQRPGRQVYRYRAPRSVCEQCPMKAACCPQLKSHGRSLVRTESSEARQAFQQRMNSREGKQVYRTRGAIAEFPFAWIKDKMRFRQFRLRGLEKVNTEALWLAVSSNILLWIRVCWRPQQAALRQSG